MKKRSLTAKQRQQQAEWEALLARHAKPLERGAKAKGIRSPKSRQKADREFILPEHTETVCSQDRFRSAFVGSTGKRDSVKYTGTSMLGTATMHKSNTVPVFNADAVIDIAKMRRN